MIKSVILLSGGLDSLVSLGLTREKYCVELALTFDYGQKSVKAEIQSSEKICKFYNLEHKVIKLDFLREITHTALVSDNDVPSGDGLANAIESAKNVWVPNRNGLFLNIAASFADSENYDYIIIGANKEEAQTFPDNTKEFVERINSEFEFSTRKCPKVLAPLINFNKNDIVKLAIDNSIPLELVHSCYDKGDNHCGVCESCTRLKNALLYNNNTELLQKLF